MIGKGNKKRNGCKTECNSVQQALPSGKSVVTTPKYEKAAAENTSDASLFQKNGFGDYEEVWDLENPSFPPLHDDRPAETRRVLPTIWLLWLW